MVVVMSETTLGAGGNASQERALAVVGMAG